jgi:predicted SAM-dependent methyltransferase
MPQPRSTRSQRSGVLAALLRRARREFSLVRLIRSNPSLGEQFIWKENRLPTRLDPPWLHLGAGENVLDEFLNLDFIPHDDRVIEWDVLDVWPDEWNGGALGALSEDLLEHFYYAEQLYVLCEINRALRKGAIFRVLMPAIDRLLRYCEDFVPRRGELLHQTYGVETTADAVNIGMRFSGHRWLHDDVSIKKLAAWAGFDARKTTCTESSEPFLSRRNLRIEEGTASFAHDLRKIDSLERITLDRHRCNGLRRVESVTADIGLYRIETSGGELAFPLGREVQVGRVVCLNLRSANLCSFREHNLKQIVLRGPRGEARYVLDESLKSKACMNLLPAPVIRLVMDGIDDAIHEIALVPGAAGDLVTAGRLEVFLGEQCP